MNDIEKTVRTLKWMVILLAVLNIGLIGFMWMHKGRGEHAGPPKTERRGHAPGARIIRDLNLNEKQIAQFEKLKQEHHEAVMKLQESSRTLRDSLFERLKSVPNAADVSALADSIAAKQKAIELVTFDHFSKLRALCGTEQQKKFDGIIDDVLHSLMGPPRPPRPPHGPPPPREGSPPHP